MSAHWKEVTSDRSFSNYSRDISSALATCIRSTLNLTHPFQLPISDARRLDALTLHGLLKEGRASWSSLHPLMGVLWGAPEEEGGDSGQPVYLLKFLAAAALKDDGTLMGPGDLASFIAHLKYGARAFCMVEATNTLAMHGSILG
jgi:hypothetical protein